MKIVQDAPPPAWWQQKILDDLINDMKWHQKSVIRRLKESGVWSKDEIRSFVWLVEKKIRAMEKMRGVNLHHFDIGKWLREG